MKALLLLGRPRRLTGRLAPRLADELHWRGFDATIAGAGDTLDLAPFDLVVLLLGAVVLPRVHTAPLDDIDQLLTGLGPLDGRPVATLLVSGTGLRGTRRSLASAIQRHGGVPLPEVPVHPLGGEGLVDLAAECMARVPPLRRSARAST